ncbi:MAG: hypothetical protein AAGB11_03330, partial [Pseudomonadota bacterium]
MNVNVDITETAETSEPDPTDHGVFLHIGAHRTGTTAIQNYLSQVSNKLQSDGIETILPPATRDMLISSHTQTLPRLVISEENCLGTMEENIWTQRLYPNAETNLRKLGPYLHSVSKVFFS